MNTPRRTRRAAALAVGLLAIGAWVGALVPAQAQLADPAAGVGDTVGDTVDTVNDTVDGAQSSVNDTVATVNETVNQVVDEVQDTLNQVLDDPTDPTTDPDPDPDPGGGGEEPRPSDTSTMPSPGTAASPARPAAPEAVSAGAASLSNARQVSDSSPRPTPAAPETRLGEGSRARFLPTTRVMALRDAGPGTGVRSPDADGSGASLPRPLVLAAAGLLTVVALGLAWASAGSPAVPARWPHRLPAALPVRA